MPFVALTLCYQSVRAQVDIARSQTRSTANRISRFL